MNRDPFDTLRSRNPAPPESLPEAPMAVASRITAGHPSLRRGLAIAAAAASVVLVAGGGWLLWSQTGGRQTVVAPPTTTSTTAGETTTTPVAGPDAPIVVVYFLKDGMLVPVARDLSVLNVRPLPDLGPLTVELLLYGPGAWDAAPLPDPVAAAEAELTTSIPEGTELLGLSVSPGVVTVDLAGLQSESRPAPPEALAQIVFTLTMLYGVEDISFLVEGVPHAVVAETLALVPSTSPPAGGTTVDPVTRLTFEEFMSPVMIEKPALGGTLPSPGVVAGSVSFFATGVRLVLTDDDGRVLWESLPEIRCGAPFAPACRGVDDWSTFEAEVPAGLVDYGRWGTISAFLLSDRFLPYAPHSQPVWLVPFVPFTEEPDLPEATTTTVGYGLGDLRPFPDDLLTGCAADTVRDPAAFEAALANGPISMCDLCAVVGVPDYETGSGLMIPVYDLADGSRLYLGYAGLAAEDLMYANLVSPDGRVRDLLGG